MSENTQDAPEDRADRLSRRRKGRSTEQPRDTTSSEESVPEEESKMDEQVKTDKTDNPNEIDNTDGMDEESDTDNMGEGDDTDNSNEQSKAVNLSHTTKEQMMHLPEEQHKRLHHLYTQMKAEYEYEYDEDYEMNRHYFPLVLQYGLDQFEEQEAAEIRQDLAEFGD